MKFAEAKSYVINLGPSKKKFSLRSIQQALRFIGNPHKQLKTILVGGTNGKGSTSTFLATILHEAGYNVGLYNSPYVKEITETIRINTTPISKKMFSQLVQELKDRIPIKLSYFEFKTLLVFYYFWKQKVDVAVLEVGLGGKLDCTNVTNPLLAIITNIHLDHTEILGNTHKKIAQDKIQIVKEGTLFITGEKRQELQNIFKTYCRNQKAYFVLIKNFSNTTSIKKLSPSFQKENASLVMNAAQILDEKGLYSISQKAIKDGIIKSKMIGRFQILQKNPRIIFDIAHNPNGIQTLCQAIKDLRYKKLIVLLGIMHDKDHEQMVNSLQKIAHIIIFTIPKIERSWKETDIESYKRDTDIFIRNTKKAYTYARKIAGRNDLIVVTGSSYLVGEIIP